MHVLITPVINIGIIAFAGNVMVLKIFGHNKALRTPANMLIVNLAVSDLGIVVGLFPECVYNFFLGGPWRFGYWGCQIHAFSGAFCGFSQIITLTCKIIFILPLIIIFNCCGLIFID